MLIDSDGSGSNKKGDSGLELSIDTLNLDNIEGINGGSDYDASVGGYELDSEDSGFELGDSTIMIHGLIIYRL